MPFKLQNAPFKHDAARDDSAEQRGNVHPDVANKLLFAY